MSVEDGKELRDLVVQTLEKKGVLGKVQAEIRASVFLALEEQDVFKDKSPFMNIPLKDYVNTPEGALVISLIREFLEFFNLEFSSMVFDPETHAGIDYKYEGRSKLAKDLLLNSTDEGKNSPLLGVFLKSLKQQVSVLSNNKSVMDNTTMKEADNVNNESDTSPLLGHNERNSSPVEMNLNGIRTNGDVHVQDSQNNQLNDILSKMQLENKPEIVEQEVQNNQSNDLFSKLIMREKLNSPKAELSVKPSSGNVGLSSLGELPPLGNIKKSEGAREKGKVVTNDLKDILDFELGDTKYEDDFMSSASEKTQKETKDDSGSEESEIEEEISTPSNNSFHADDATVDISVSKSSLDCDYKEDL